MDAFGEFLKLGMKTKPFAHQAETWLRSRAEDVWALLLEQGLGKTLIALATALWMWREKRIDAMIVIGNKGSYMNWLRLEIPAHWPDDEPVELAYWSSYQTSEWKRQWERACKTKDKFVILAINVEAFSSQRLLDELPKFMKGRKILMVVDESTVIKHHKSGRSKAIVKLGKSAVAKRIMTGSPLPESPLNAWGQCEFLRHGILGFTSYTAFKERYAIEDIKQYGNRSFVYVSGYRMLDELGEKMKAFSTRLLKADCLDLPEKIYATRAVELTREQARAYKDLREKLVHEFEAGLVTSTPHALTKLVRLHQIALGFLLHDDGTVSHLPNNRLDALDEVIEETAGKLIIWTNYREAIKLVGNHLRAKWGGPAAVVEYWGGATQEQRVEGLDRFQSGDARFFLGNPAVGGYGITLTASSNALYYSNSFKAEERRQSEDRTHRIGQRQNCLYTDLISQGTIDERVLNALRSKQELEAKVLGEWKQLLDVL